MTPERLTPRAAERRAIGRDWCSWTRALVLFAGFMFGACADPPTSTIGASRQRTAAISSEMAAGGATRQVTAAAATVEWLAPLGAATPQPGANDDAASGLSIVVCEAKGADCVGAPVATYTRTSGPAGRVLTVDATLGAFAADFDLTSAAFTTRKTYHIQVRQDGVVLGAVDVDIVRGRWARTTLGALAPLRAAATLPIRVRVVLPPIRFEPSSAAPLTIVTVTGLPAEYAANPVQISVAGRPSVLARGASGESWTLIVPPDVPTGPAAVVLPANAGTGSLTGTLRIVAPTYLGGSPAATVETLSADMAEVQAAIAQLQLTLSPTQDAALLRRLVGLNRTFDQLRQYVSAMAPADRTTFASFYSVNRSYIKQVFDLLSQVATSAATDPPLVGASTLGSRNGPGAGAAASNPLGLRSVGIAAAPGPDDLVGRCEAHVGYMERAEQAQYVLSVIESALGLASLIPTPPLKAVAGIVTVLAITTDVIGAVLDYQTVLLAPAGLLLEFQPARVNAGTGGTMRASVALHSNKSVVGIISGGVLKTVLEGFFEAKRLVRESAPLIKRALAELGVDEFLYGVDLLLDDIGLNEIGGVRTGRGYTTLDRVDYLRGVNADLWSFTSPNTGLSRTFATKVPPDARDHTVLQGAIVGSGSRECSAVTGDPIPGSGLNGFIIAFQNAITLTPANPSARLRQGTSTAVPLATVNLTDAAITGLSYSVTTAPGGAPLLPPGLSASLTGTSSILGALATRNFTLNVSASSAVPLGRYLIPVSVRQTASGVAPQLLASTLVSVEVTSQLTGIVVNTLTPTFQLYDNGNLQDGDRVSVTLNGQTVFADLSLLFAGTSTQLALKPGANTLIITALNEGSSPPNTAAYRMSNVVSGPASQGYGLNTGQVVSLLITADVPTSQMAHGADAAVTTGTRSSAAADVALPPRLPVQCEGPTAPGCVRQP